MINPTQRAEELLHEWNQCKNARPRGDAINLQIERDDLEKWARQLSYYAMWQGDEIHTIETIYQFESRLNSYKQKVIIEILTHGTI
jgi:hypothetical protein